MAVKRYPINWEKNEHRVLFVSNRARNMSYAICTGEIKGTREEVEKFDKIAELADEVWGNVIVKRGPYGLVAFADGKTYGKFREVLGYDAAWRMHIEANGSDFSRI